MNTRLCRLLCLAFLTAAVSMPSHVFAADWEPLFDGKSLTGWTQLNGTATYRVEDGAIVGKTNEGSPNSFLCSDRYFGDFELEFEVKCHTSLNSGVQIRSNSFAYYNNGRVHGYQVEIEEGSAGFIYDEARRGWLSLHRQDQKKNTAFKANEWNKYRVLAVGDRIKTWVNGVMIADEVDDMTKVGFIGLQVHGIKRGTGPFEVRWRNIRVKDMSKPAVLYGRGGSLAQFRNGDKSQWKNEGDVLSIQPGKGGSLVTKEDYRDFRLHVEFNVPHDDTKPWGNNGNSGVYLQRRYEVQILQSFGRTPTKSDCAALYRFREPDMNASRPAGTWQEYDIVFRAARWEGEKKTQNARITVYHNGTLVHNDVELPNKTGAGQKEGPTPGPILFQDHGNPVSYRNIWIEKLDLQEPSTKLNLHRKLIADGAAVEKVASGFKFVEGPAEGPDGRIYFSDIPNERIHVFDPKTGKTEVFREKTGRANGLMFDKQGRLYACEGGARRLTRMDIKTKKLEVLAESYNGKKLNSPNDIDLLADGGLFFTDPRYGNRDDMEMDVEGVYHLDAKGKLTRVIDKLKRPNGLILTKDQGTLYVVDNGAGQLWSYRINRQGKLGGAQLFGQFDAGVQRGGDGATLDENGYVYVAGRGGVWVWNRAGSLVTVIKTPEGPANCTIAGPEKDTLYITARTSLYRVKLAVKGR